MSKRKRTTNGHFSLAQYRSEVDGEPFVLDVDDEKTIVIERPTGDQMFAAEAAMRRGDSKQTIRELCGDVSKDVLAIFGPEDALVLKQFSEDLQSHFGLGE